MKKTWLAAASALVLSAPVLAEPTISLPGPAFPKFTTAEQVNQACDAGLAQAKAAVRTLEKRKAGKGWLAAFDAVLAGNEDVQGPVEFVLNVSPEKAVRDAAQACSQRWADFTSSFYQNEKVFRALKQTQPQDAIDRESRQLVLAQFEDSGVALPKAKRARAKAINDRLSDLGQAFNKNIRDANVQVAFTEAELKGVPEAVWKEAKRDAQGRVLLGVDYPSYGPVLQHAEDAAARERMWRAKANEGGEANIKLLAEVTKLRAEYAKLFGFDDYVDFNLRRRMAKNSATAWKFLGEVKTAVQEREMADLAELRSFKAQHLGLDKDAKTPVKIERWDVSFYGERVSRARYSVDQEAFREYFPAKESLQFALHVIEKMMGVRYTEVPADLWHPEVKAYVVSDVASGKVLGSLYVDMFPREGKYNHAAVWPLRGSSTLTGRLPSAALVVNFNRKGLTIDEMETLLHELGHSVHTDLSNTRYTLAAGTSVMGDFVEAPSQMLEDWVLDKKVLKLMTDVCPTCKPVPDDLVDRAEAAKSFGKGSRFSRQHFYASYDLAVHGKALPEPLAQWEKMERESPLGHVDGTLGPAGFAHIANNYGAGYYGYLWSLVVAMDLRTPFKADKLSADVGQRYRSRVLAQGGQKPAPELVQDFLGRPFNSAAFFDHLRK